MNKLLSANFARLKKSKIFWICMVFMFGYGVLAVINQYRSALLYDGRFDATLDAIFFTHIPILGLLLPAFCSLFLGTEYSDGTIRNKLIVGHLRTSIYLSNLITAVLFALAMCVAYFLPICILGTLLLGWLTTELLTVLTVLIGSTLAIIAISCICTMLSMTNQNKTVTAIVSMMGMLALQILAVVVMAKIDAPERIDLVTFTDSMGGMATESIPNPMFLTGAKRTLYEFFFDFLPTGQGLQYLEMITVRMWQKLLCSLFIISLTTGIGLSLFQRKDIK